MPKTPSLPPDQDDLPGFETAEIPEEEPQDLHDLLGDEYVRASHPTSTAPSTTSPLPSPPRAEPGSRGTPSASTTGFTDDDDDEPPTSHDEDLAEGLEFLAGGLFELFGQTMNRMARVRRRGQRTRRWLVSDEEAEAFAEPVARIAERHLPDELKTGDAKDVVIAGSVALEYGVRNMADLVEEQPPGAFEQRQQAIHEPGPQPAPPPPPVEPAPQPRSQAGPSAAAEAPPLVPPSI